MKSTHRPRDAHLANIEQKGFDRDPAQLVAVEALDALFERLLAARAPEANGWWSRWVARKPEPVEGLYLWGGVGRGKTYLMDLFHECLPFDDKLRMHFHRFMQRVHAELKDLGGTANPLERVADRFCDDGRVLCFDEFFVSDIGDAMILGELFKALFDRGVTIVATSNVEPNELYKDGLQRRRFLPAIELIQKHMRVLNLDGDTDYRLRVLTRSSIYCFPAGEATDAALMQSMRDLAPEALVADEPIVVNGREIATRHKADDVVWFDFRAICDGPRSANDYIEIARVFHAVLISDIPELGPDNEDQARRFISLIDEFYDRNVKLIVSADAPLAELYRGERLKFEFERTQSRLTEMQSQEYLARSHRA